MTAVVLKALLIWLVTAVAEVLHGILRFRLLNHRVGDHRARQTGVFTGSAIILVITWFSVPWLGASTTGQFIGVGFLWLVLMLAFEIAFGRAGTGLGFDFPVFRLPSRRRYGAGDRQLRFVHLQLGPMYRDQVMNVQNPLC